MLTEIFNIRAKYYKINLNRWLVISKRLWGWGGGWGGYLLLASPVCACMAKLPKT